MGDDPSRSPGKECQKLECQAYGYEIVRLIADDVTAPDTTIKPATRQRVMRYLAIF